MQSLAAYAAQAYTACLADHVWNKQKNQWEQEIKQYVVLDLSRPAHCQCVWVTWGLLGSKRSSFTSGHTGKLLLLMVFHIHSECQTCFCCPGAVWVAHEHAVVLWYPVVSQKSCHPLCSFIWWTAQHLLYHGRQHGWVEAEARWPGIEKHAAKKVVRKRIKHGFVGSLWRMFQLYACRSTNLLWKKEIVRFIGDDVSLLFSLPPFIFKAFILIWKPWSVWYRTASPTPAASPADCTTECRSTPKEAPQMDPAACGSIVLSE